MRVKSVSTYNSCFKLPGLDRGFIDFLDDTHWSVHPQYRGSEWSIQHACFTYDKSLFEKRNDFASFMRRCQIGDWGRKTDVDSCASGLKRGDERYVEVEVTRWEDAEHMTEEEVKAAMESAREQKIAAARIRKDAISAADMSWLD